MTTFQCLAQYQMSHTNPTVFWCAGDVATMQQLAIFSAYSFFTSYFLYSFSVIFQLFLTSFPYLFLSYCHSHKVTSPDLVLRIWKKPQQHRLLCTQYITMQNVLISFIYHKLSPVQTIWVQVHLFGLPFGCYSQGAGEHLFFLVC